MSKPSNNRNLAIASAIAPVLLIFGLIWWFFNGGSNFLERESPPLEEVSIIRVDFLKDTGDSQSTPEKADGMSTYFSEGRLIEMTIRNTGADPVDLTIVTVDEAIWKVYFEPESQHLERFQKGKITIPFNWVDGDPYVLTVFTSNGESFEAEVFTAMETLKPNRRQILIFAGMGVYVGILPVLFGILFLPCLRQLSTRWTQFILSLTLGLLIFLGIDSLHEALEFAEELPGAYEGVALVAFGFLLAFMLITAVDRAARKGMSGKGGDENLILAYLIAFGIGIHNLGEGLAIGGAYALGEAALGATLLIGFTLHNTTEGLAIVAPLTRSRVRLRTLAVLGLIGGGPAIIGCWIGGFSFSTVWSVLFLAIGAGAIAQVVWTISRSMVKVPEGNLFNYRNACGLLLGMLLMYGTAMMVTA